MIYFWLISLGLIMQGLWNATNYTAHSLGRFAVII